jgi:type IV pilus assembly protein PilO
MKRLSKREKILLTVCMTLIIIYAYYSFFLTPILKKITVLHEQIDKDNVAINNINIVKSQNKKQNEQLQSIQVKYTDASKALPTSEKNPEITSEIKKLADNNKIIINSIDLGKSSEYKNQSVTANNKAATKKDELSNGVSGKLMITPVTLNITGDYLNMIDFISSIEQDKRIVEINTLNISTDSNNAMQATININYYYLDPK